MRLAGDLAGLPRTVFDKPGAEHFYDHEPTGCWMTNFPATTPIADLVRWAKMRWRSGHDYRELRHSLRLDHFEGRTWRGWHHHVTLVTAAQAFLTLRRRDPRAQMSA